MTEHAALFIGEVAIDEYYRAPRWPGVGDKVTVETLPLEPGGTIANAAACYAGFGAPTSLVYVLNDGPVSALLCADLERSGVATDLIVRMPGIPDSKTIVVMSGEEHTILIPDRPFSEIVLSAAAVDALRAAPFVYSTPADLRLLRHDDAGPAELLELARASGTRIAVDLDVGELEPADRLILEQVDVVFVNDVGDARSAAEGYAFRDWARRDAHHILVVTHAAQGCTVVTRQGEHRVAGIGVDAVDVTGAGDTFGSAFLYALARTGRSDVAAEFANAAAARSVTFAGPRGGVASPRQVVDFASGRVPAVVQERIMTLIASEDAD